MGLHTKKNFAGALPRTPTGGAATPPVTPLLRPTQRTARGASRGKNITHTQHAGQSMISFTIALFTWLRQLHIVIEKHPCAGMDFRGDPNLILPTDAQLGAIGIIF